VSGVISGIGLGILAEVWALVGPQLQELIVDSSF